VVKIPEAMTGNPNGEAAPATPAMTEAATKTKITSAEDFLTRSPLHVVIRIDGFHPPEQISFDCNRCGKETTWFQVYNPTALKGDTHGGGNTTPDYRIKSVAYTCFLCKKNTVTVIYREMETEERPVSRPQATGITRAPGSPPAKTSVLIGVQKIGQYPSPSVTLPKALEKNLGNDAAGLYRKALICRNNGYGLAAAVYMRRVVEDKTNELIEVAAQLAELHSAGAETVAIMRAAANSKEYTPYEDKLKIAATVFPDSLKVGSINPLKTLYGLVSKGIHGLGEAECITIADQTTDVFDFIFTKLRAEVADRQSFVDKVKKLTDASA
jgi:hypothetical protein